ncbi:putative nicotinate-nucleotide adenylyltransferase [Amylibacter cionae]|uniref:Probable nicotinate-nucleotide adenylyltransferase n=1 Tax=Neptunicoccus cionae TaxID=2035344 RepID=A0A916QQN1_9RHOB|nr:nicotinate-nucleotide adenylyltransferase [Amylibacter cionae]GGA05380.1 putative nicotinate-nucleotide adenylyltransferase [Amylibacter cionae]
MTKQAHFPLATAGQRIGLLGGSFDPPHQGHLHISRWALKSFGLDRVWWMVSPGNPLKARGPASMGRRLEACRALADDPRMVVTDIESHLGTRYTAATLQALLPRYRGARFVWLMGADNLAEFHRWKDWDWIMEALPIGVLGRPGEQLAAGCSPAARRYRNYRLQARRAEALPFREAPCWSLLTGPMVRLSSTQIRAQGDWPTSAGGVPSSGKTSPET